jgi:hypothetical protein
VFYKSTYQSKPYSLPLQYVKIFNRNESSLSDISGRSGRVKTNPTRITHTKLRSKNNFGDAA